VDWTGVFLGLFRGLTAGCNSSLSVWKAGTRSFSFKQMAEDPISNIPLDLTAESGSAQMVFLEQSLKSPSEEP
jgi:hypothetical protein